MHGPAGGACRGVDVTGEILLCACVPLPFVGIHEGPLAVGRNKIAGHLLHECAMSRFRFRDTGLGKGEGLELNP